MIATLRHRVLHGFALCLAIHSLWSPRGWATETGTPSPPVFSLTELVAYKGKGRSTLTGQVFLAAFSGNAVTQAGVPAHLVPVTPYTRTGSIATCARHLAQRAASRRLLTAPRLPA